MFEIRLKRITEWRNQTAQKEGVDLFRVLPNKTLEELARKNPQNKEEMTQIKGIKEAKYKKYGKEILGALKNVDRISETKNNEDIFLPEIAEDFQRKTLTVSRFLDTVNENLLRLGARIVGEVSSLDIRERVIYFSLKDKEDESLINCLIFRYQYEMLGVKLEEGMEIIVEGVPEIYKPYGRLSLKVSVIELQGEGALKKEYEMLKKKLEMEGFFSLERKKKPPFMPTKIGLITSREGAAIGDFMTNIGQYGFQIKFYNSSVEGKKAVFELIEAIKYFQKKSDIEVLVIIRGGGSLESLQAFNNESLIREAKKVKAPIVCGVGHDRDVSLLSLSSDISVSTPTAAAEYIKYLWTLKIDEMRHYENNILNSFWSHLAEENQKVSRLSSAIQDSFSSILSDIDIICRRMIDFAIEKINLEISNDREKINREEGKILYRFEKILSRAYNEIERAENIIKLNNPIRQLKLGYGIISKNGTGIRSIQEIKKEDEVKIRLFDGEALSQIKNIKKILQKNGKENQK